MREYLIGVLVFMFVLPFVFVFMRGNLEVLFSFFVPLLRIRGQLGRVPSSGFPPLLHFLPDGEPLLRPGSVSRLLVLLLGSEATILAPSGLHFGLAVRRDLGVGLILLRRASLPFVQRQQRVRIVLCDDQNEI